MRSTFQATRNLGLSALLVLSLFHAQVALTQQVGRNVLKVTRPAANADVAAIGTLLQALQTEVQGLKEEVRDLKRQQQAAQVETAELRRELDLAKTQSYPGKSEAVATGQVREANPAAPASIDERIARLEESQQLANAEIAEQSQTKVESQSKYRVRLSGIVLLNMFGERGHTDTIDFPQLAIAPDPLASGGSFAGSIRQSQIGLQAFGPTIAGARTSAEIQFDLAGGFPGASNGVSFGILRLRTGTFRFDWANTSLVGGQDALFIAPLNPTSLATLATPALAYSGNLWNWAPQVRLEHRFGLSETSSLLVQGGILDNLTGDVPDGTYTRSPSWGEQSGQPAYAARVAWTKKMAGEDLTVGAGGYYSRQNWGLGRKVDGWAGTADLKVPLGRLFEFTGQFYRGRAVGGIGGALGQTALWNAPFTDPATEIYGLDSTGGWAQMKYRATPKLQFNAALGQDNPFASDLRNFGGNGAYTGQLLSKNQSGLVNFIFQPRSDFELSVEYRKLKTFILNNGTNAANRVNLSIGYIF